MNSYNADKMEPDAVASLNAVTTHFAQVQFRLRQIIDAPTEEKESLLRELEQFSFQGLLPYDENHVDVKERLISQLQRQIFELEHSLKSLQDKSDINGISNGEKDSERFHKEEWNEKEDSNKRGELNRVEDRKKKEIRKREDTDDGKGLKNNSISKVAGVLRMISSERDDMKRRLFGPKNVAADLKQHHWGDARAELEFAIADVLRCFNSDDSDYMSSDSDISQAKSDAVNVVRKRFAPALRNLMQHGLTPNEKSVSKHQPLLCLPRFQIKERREMHAWELFLKYFQAKNGERLLTAPASTLARSFNLSAFDDGSVSHKLLLTIGNVWYTHDKYKRSYNTQFKAFVCAALNGGTLASWLRLVYKYQPLVECYYERWSYAAVVGFEDCCKSLERLNRQAFRLPVDLAVRDFQNIKDAF